jgi:hypothetical protein
VTGIERSRQYNRHRFLSLTLSMIHVRGPRVCDDCWVQNRVHESPSAIQKEYQGRVDGPRKDPTKVMVDIGHDCHVYCNAFLSYRLEPM